jgi:hypothetical protein
MVVAEAVAVAVAVAVAGSGVNDWGWPRLVGLVVLADVSAFAALAPGGGGRAVVSTAAALPTGAVRLLPSVAAGFGAAAFFLERLPPLAAARLAVPRLAAKTINDGGGHAVVNAGL